MVEFIRRELRIPAVQHLTCAGHTVEEIDQIVEALQRQGISNILALRGDPPKGSDKFLPHPQGFSCARDLTNHINRKYSVSLAVAGYPGDSPGGALARK